MATDEQRMAMRNRLQGMHDLCCGVASCLAQALGNVGLTERDRFSLVADALDDLEKAARGVNDASDNATMDWDEEKMEGV